MKKIVLVLVSVISLTGCSSAGFNARPVDGGAYNDDNLVRGGNSECFYIEEWSNDFPSLSTPTNGLGVFCKEDR